MMSTTRKHILHINVFITSLIGIILGYMLFTQYFGPHSHSINAINTQRPAEKPFFKTWVNDVRMYIYKNLLHKCMNKYLRGTSSYIISITAVENSI